MARASRELFPLEYIYLYSLGGHLNKIIRLAFIRMSDFKCPFVSREKMVKCNVKYLEILMRLTGRLSFKQKLTVYKSAIMYIFPTRLIFGKIE